MRVAGRALGPAPPSSWHTLAVGLRPVCTTGELGHEAEFTLVELGVGMFILGVGIVASVGVFLGVTRSVTGGKDRRLAIAVATSYVEAIRTNPNSAVVFDAATSTRTYGYAQNWVDDPATVRVPDFKRVVVVARWTGGGASAPTSCGLEAMPVDISQGADIAFPTQAAAHFQLYVRGSTTVPTTLNLKSKGTFLGGVYAPESDIAIQANADLFGGFVGNTMDLQGNRSVHYDAALAGQGSAGTSRVQQIWYER